MCDLSAFAQTRALSITGDSANGVVRVPPTSLKDGKPFYWQPPGGQVIIPRYANGATPPAGQIVGFGPTSVIQATKATETLPEAARALVTTESFDKPARQFQGQLPNDTAGKAVLQPVIRDVTIVGRDVKGDDFWNNGDVDDSGKPGVDKYDGLRWKASGGLVENVGFFGIPGTAAIFTRGGSANNKAGGVRPFDNSKLKLWTVNVARCNRGIDVNVVDAAVGRISGAYCKEYVLKLSAGATQIDGAVHTWGGEHGVWITGSLNWGGPLYCEQGPVALDIDGSSNDLGPIYAHSCSVACIRINGTNNTLRQLRVPTIGVEPVCVEINDQYNSIAGARILAAANQKGIVLKHAGGVGFQLLGGIISGNAGSTLIDCTGTPAPFGLTEAVIEVELRGGTVGLDLRRDDGSSVLRGNNRIQVITPVTGAIPTTIVDLPSGWQSKTPHTTTNVITINGVRFYPPRDE